MMKLIYSHCLLVLISFYKKRNENEEILKLEQKSRKIKLHNVVIYVNSQYDVMSNIIE